jgi:phosphate/sulfate permease
MILFFLASGLFLGWSLGAQDASNIFGSAIGSKMVSFRKAAIIASVFVILGAVLQGSGASETLARLGSVNAVGGSFTVALAAAITLYMMTRFSIPVSSTQAIVGAIIGWNFFTGNPTDTKVLSQIFATWITGPILGALFAMFLYMMMRNFKRRANIHLVRFELYMKTGLIIVGAFGAYSLGANNIANVMGVFLPAFELNEIDFGIFMLNSNQQLFLLGGLAVALGIATYSKKVIQTIGTGIVELSSETALVVVLSQALVLFIFSSSVLSAFLESLGLPRIPMVPVSSSQVVVGSLIGIGLYKGVRNINFKLLGEIGIGWILTPFASAVLSFFLLFFVKNVFGLNVGSVQGGSVVQQLNDAVFSHTESSEMIRYLLIGAVIAGVIAITYLLLLEKKRTREMEESEERFWRNMK